MRENLKQLIIKNIKNNSKSYILIIATFIAGVVLSGMLNISAGSEEEIRLYLNDFFSTVKNYGTDSSKTFGIAMSGYIKSACVFFLLSVSMIGGAGILAYVFIKGFSFGIVVMSVANILGARSILFFLSVVLPHAIVAVPCFLVYSAYCIRCSYIVFRGNKNLKINVILPLLYGVASILVWGVAALVQAYIEPILMRIIV